jgi:hypothetical protein
MNWQLIEPDLPLIVADFAIVTGSRLARMLHYGICMRRGVDAGGDLVNEYRVVCGRRLVVFRSIFGRRAEKRCGGYQREYQSDFAEGHDLFLLWLTKLDFCGFAWTWDRIWLLTICCRLK